MYHRSGEVTSARTRALTLSTDRWVRRMNAQLPTWNSKFTEIISTAVEARGLAKIRHILRGYNSASTAGGKKRSWNHVLRIYHLLSSRRGGVASVVRARVEPRKGRSNGAKYATNYCNRSQKIIRAARLLFSGISFSYKTQTIVGCLFFSFAVSRHRFLDPQFLRSRYHQKGILLMKKAYILPNNNHYFRSYSDSSETIFVSFII